MRSFCLKCRKKTKIKTMRAAKTKRGKPMLLSKCAGCDSENPRFIKDQKAVGLSS